MTGSDPLLLVFGVVAVALLALAVSYNRFVQQRQLVANSWSNIDTELRRRHDLIPSLVATVQGYADHEQGVFEAVTAARAAAVAGPRDDIAVQARQEGALSSALRQVFAVAEGYPQLQASANFLQLQRELVSTEDRIQAARRFHNANVRDLNRRVESFPSNLVAGWFGVTRAAYFEVESSVRDTVPEV